MRRRNSAAARPIATSVSIPRARKISAARGLNSSAINTFGMTFSLRRLGGVALLVPGPVEPWQERLDIAPLDRRAGPDADPRRRGAVAGEGIAGAFGFQPSR